MLVGQVFLVCGLLSMAGDGGPDKMTKVPQFDAAAFYETVSYVGASFSADESRLLLSSDASGVFNVYAIPVTGGKPEQLTHSTTNATFAGGWFPADDRFLYTADEGGNELNHVYVHELDGSSRDLTPGKYVKAAALGWLDDKSWFYVQTNEREPQHFDLYRYRTDGYKREMVFRNDTGWMLAGVSRDGRWVALGKVNTNADTDIYLWDSHKPDADPVNATPHKGAVQHTMLSFSPDSRLLYYGTDEHGEFREVWSYEIASGERKAVVKANWDVTSLHFSRSGRYRIQAVNADARTVVTILDTQTGEQVKLPDLPQGELSDVLFSESDRWLALYVDSDTSPPNLYVCDMQKHTAARLTDSLNPKIKPEYLVDGEVIRYNSFDGLEIPAVLYRPHGASAEDKAPALVWVHGGPGGQSRKGYSATIQHLVNHGYAVLGVNNRGSSGYGKTFYHMDDRKHGDVDLKDCVAARAYLASLPWVDGKHIGIIGGSYGGYIVTAALAFKPDAFDAGIDIFGVTNWLRTLQNIPPWWASFRDSLYAEMGDPATDEKRLRAISPLFHARDIRSPLLVVQGANDPRVLKAESDEIVEAVRANGIPVEYIVFPDEGHGFRNRENRIRASDAYVEFLNKHLRGNAADSSPQTP